ncbi:MAG: helix-turn-helix domain-containing protein [Actinobacteria bacterium]|nr:helix-turn-helix domain-containing protein [Actinomycetota bacterium]
MSKELNKQIGEKVRKARVLANLTLKEVADKTSIGYVTISRIEHGTRAVNAAELILIANVTKQPISFFYELDEVIEYFDPRNFKY